jgi:probable rRNA maturation factor
MPRKPAKKTDLKRLAERRLKRLLAQAHKMRTLKGLLPAPRWDAHVSLVGPTVMKRLNSFYRKKAYETDVLSFEAPAAFRAQGFLGELILCGSVLKRQAREHGNSDEKELQILLVHGLLHLLGFDHEKGARQAQEMQNWEAKLLGARVSKKGLISRASPIQ